MYVNEKMTDNKKLFLNHHSHVVRKKQIKILQRFINKKKFQ